jgi:hypothetical protein
LSGKKRKQLASRQLLLKQHGAGLARAVELKHILRQIDADHIKRLHGQTSWLWLRILQPWQLGAAGGASTPLYLFRAVDKHGQLIDFMLADRRNARAAFRFLRKALKTMSDCPLSSITTDKLASYPKAIRRLQKEGLLSKRSSIGHRDI